MDSNATNPERTDQTHIIEGNRPDLFDNLPDLPDIDDIFPSNDGLNVAPADDDRSETPILDQLVQPQPLLHVDQEPVKPSGEPSQSVFPCQTYQPLLEALPPHQQGVLCHNSATLSNAPFSTPPIPTNPLLGQATHHVPNRDPQHANQVPPYASPPLNPTFAPQETQIPPSLLFPPVNNAYSPGEAAASALLPQNVDLSIVGDLLKPEHLTQDETPLQQSTHFENDILPTNSCNLNASSTSVGVKRSRDEVLDSDTKSDAKRMRVSQQNEGSNGEANISGSVLKVWLYGGHYFKLMLVEDPKNCACGKRYATINQLNRHMKASHRGSLQEESRSESGLLQCTHCGHRFKNETNLRRHTINVHNENNTIICDIEDCFANFSSKISLAIHKRDYHGITPASRKKKQMSQQRLLESGNQDMEPLKVYVCHTCNDIAENKGNMMRHIRIVHLRICDFVCDICNSKFRTKSNLQAHKSSKTCMRNAQRSSPPNETGSCEQSEHEPAEASQEMTNELQEPIEVPQELFDTSTDLEACIPG